MFMSDMRILSASGYQSCHVDLWQYSQNHVLSGALLLLLRPITRVHGGVARLLDSEGNEIESRKCYLFRVKGVDVEGYLRALLDGTVEVDTQVGDPVRVMSSNDSDTIDYDEPFHVMHADVNKMHWTKFVSNRFIFRCKSGNSELIVIDESGEGKPLKLQKSEWGTSFVDVNDGNECWVTLVPPKMK